MDFRFQGDTARPLLLFQAVGAPFRLRARVFQGKFTRPIWEAFQALNNGVMRPAAPVEVNIPVNFCGSSNTGENRRLLVVQPYGCGPTVFKFDQPIPKALPEAIRLALAPVVAPPALSEPPPDLAALEDSITQLEQDFFRAQGETHEEHHRKLDHLPRNAKGQPRPRKRRRYGKSSKGVKQQRAQQREG